MGDPLNRILNRLRFVFPEPATCFVVIGSLFGLLYLVCVPPFQVPDENRHFWRAYQIAEGHWISQVHDGQAGGWLPVSIAECGVSTEAMNWDFSEKTTRADIQSRFSTPLNPDQRVFVPLRSAVYSPVAYLPAAAAMRTAMLGDVSPLMLMYIGRLANLLCWLVLTWYAIHNLPFYKWLFVVLALTPMSLVQAASLSADSLTNALAFLCLALFLSEAFTARPFDRRSLYRLLIVTILLVLTKNVFLLFCLLFFIIPARRFASRRQYLVNFSILVIGSTAALAIWALTVRHLPVDWKMDVFPERQAAWILRHPVDYLLILARTLARYYWYYYTGFVGAFGWKFFYLGAWHVRLWMLLIVLVSLTDADREKTIALRQKSLLAVVFAATGGLIFTLLYACWNPVGAPLIEGVQARYFIPIAPLLCMLFSNRRLSTDRFCWKSAVIPVATVVSLSAALTVIIERFYQAA